MNKEWYFATGADVTYDTVGVSKDAHGAYATLCCLFPSGDKVKTDYTVSENGVQIEITGNGELAYLLPIFEFDGAVHTKVEYDEQHLTVTYRGWCCTYTTTARFEMLSKYGANRNGHYRAFVAVGSNALCVTVNIYKEENRCI